MRLVKQQFPMSSAKMNLRLIIADKLNIPLQRHGSCSAPSNFGEFVVTPVLSPNAN